MNMFHGKLLRVGIFAVPCICAVSLSLLAGCAAPPNESPYLVHNPTVFMEEYSVDGDVFSTQVGPANSHEEFLDRSMPHQIHIKYLGEFGAVMSEKTINIQWDDKTSSWVEIGAK